LATTQGNYAPATATALATAQTDLDTLTGTDGVTLATSQPNYAPNTTTPPTANAIADQVWDEAASGHVSAGSFGVQCGTDIDAILVDTDEIQGKLPADGTDIAGSGQVQLVETNLTTEIDANETKLDSVLAFQIAEYRKVGCHYDDQPAQEEERPAVL